MTDTERTIRNRVFVGLFVVAAAARVIAALTLGDRFHFVDEADYSDAARRLLVGDGFGPSYGRVPAYPVLLALLMVPLPDSLTALRTAQALICALGAALTFELGRRLFGLWPAAAAGAIFALDPLMVVASGLLYPEAAAALALTVAVILWNDAGTHRSLWREALAGALVALAGLLRPVALLILPALLLWRLGTGPGRAPAQAPALVVAALAFGLTLLPWGVRNLQMHGQFSVLPTTGIRSTVLKHADVEDVGVIGGLVGDARANPLQTLRWSLTRFAQFWEFYPTRLATDSEDGRAELHAHDDRLPVKATFPRGLRDQVSILSFGTEFVLALIGLLVVIRRKPREAFLLLATILSFALGYAMLVSKMRYRIPILPFFYIFSGLGAVATFELVRSRLWTHRAGRG